MTRKRLNVALLHSALDYVRAHRRISWRTVADEAGVSPSTLTRLGQGHAPDADGLCALMAWLGDSIPLSRFTIDAEEDA